MNTREQINFAQYIANTRRASRRVIVRSLARIIDALFVAVSLQLLSELSYDNFPLFFFVYNVICCFFGGNTLGRFAFGLEIRTKDGSPAITQLLIREILFALFFFIILLQIITGFRLLHDLLVRTYFHVEA